MRQWILWGVVSLLIAGAAQAQGIPAVSISPVTDVTVTGSATLVLAANMNRSSISCTNTSASVHVRWGNSAVTSTKGQRLPAGGSVEIRNRAAVYMVSEGANVTVSCTEELR